MQEASFDTSGKVTFAEQKRKPLDPTRLQAAMFSDRPDLWRKVKKAQAPRQRPGQTKLL